MSKKIVTVTTKGVRESISGASQELPTSAEFRFGDAVIIPSTSFVPTNQTGTITNESIVTVLGAGLVILPAEPVVGQTIKVAGVVVPGTAFGVTASHSINYSGPLGINLSSSYGTFTREFMFLTDSVASWWLTPDAFEDGPFGLTGTYTF